MQDARIEREGRPLKGDQKQRLGERTDGERVPQHLLRAYELKRCNAELHRRLVWPKPRLRRGGSGASCGERISLNGRPRLLDDDLFIGLIEGRRTQTPAQVRDDWNRHDGTKRLDGEEQQLRQSCSSEHGLGEDQSLIER